MKRFAIAPLTALAVVLLAAPLMAQMDNSATPPNVPANPRSFLVAGGGSLTTLFAGNNGFAGNTFDIENVGTQPVTILSWDINCTPGPNPLETVTVYWKVGTAVGNENNPGAWTLMGVDSNVDCAGLDLPTPVAVGGVTLNPGDLFGFYIDLTSYDGINLLNYTNGGPNTYTNPEIELTSNTGQSSPAFGGSFFPRIWNGTVYYDIVPVELQSFDIE